MLCWSQLAKGNEVEIELQGPKEIILGSTFNISVDVTNISNFDAANFDILFNPDYISVIDVFNGKINDTEVPVSMWNIVDENKLRVILNLPGIDGVSGDGLLTTIEFNSLKSGSVTLTVDNSVLSNSNASEITATWSNYVVEINSMEEDEKSSEFPLFLIILVIILIVLILIIIYYLVFFKKNKK